MSTWVLKLVINKPKRKQYYDLTGSEPQIYSFSQYSKFFFLREDSRIQWPFRLESLSRDVFKSHWNVQWLLPGQTHLTGLYVSSDSLQGVQQRTGDLMCVRDRNIKKNSPQRPSRRIRTVSCRTETWSFRAKHTICSVLNRPLFPGYLVSAEL